MLGTLGGGWGREAGRWTLLNFQCLSIVFEGFWKAGVGHGEVGVRMMMMVMMMMMMVMTMMMMMVVVVRLSHVLPRGAPRSQTYSFLENVTNGGSRLSHVLPRGAPRLVLGSLEFSRLSHVFPRGAPRS